MSEECNIRATLGDVMEDRTDWARVDAMTEEEIEEVARLDPDNPILDAELWKNARAVFHQSVYKDAHIRVDEDVLEWFEKQGKGYHARMNTVLRAYMNANSSLTTNLRNSDTENRCAVDQKLVIS